MAWNWEEFSSEAGLRGANTYDVNTLVPGNTDLGALRTKINTDNRHCRRRICVGGYRGKRKEEW